MKIFGRKGFTLVELIVVIAIIGVLVGVLIPTMIGYVTNSRIASANTTAVKIRDNMNYWLTDLDSKKSGMFMTGEASTKAEISVNEVGGEAVWTITLTSGLTDIKDAWSAEVSDELGNAVYKESDTGATSGGAVAWYLGKSLADHFPDIDKGYIIIYLLGGRCIGVSFTTDSSAGIDTEPGGDGNYPIITFNANGVDIDHFDGTTDFRWPNEEGRSKNGFIVGTSYAVWNTI